MMAWKGGGNWETEKRVGAEDNGCLFISHRIEKQYPRTISGCYASLNFLLLAGDVHCRAPLLQSIKSDIKVSSEYQQLCKISACRLADKKSNYSNPIKAIRRKPDTCFTNCQHKFSLLISKMHWLCLHLKVSPKPDRSLYTTASRNDVSLLHMFSGVNKAKLPIGPYRWSVR